MYKNANDTRKTAMVCSTCGSEEVRRNADLAWSVPNQEWEIVAIFDSSTCETCGGECSIDEKEIE